MNFTFQPFVCNDCHDLLQNVMSINDVAIVSINRNSYRTHLLGISKDKAACLLKKVNLNERVKV